MDKQPKKLLIDADYLVYSVGFVSEDVSEKLAKSRLTQTVEDMVYIDLKADTYMAYLTGDGNFRYDIAVTLPYKGNRKDMKKPKHYVALREHLCTRLGAMMVHGQEADDEVAIKMSVEPDKYLLVGVDKDLLQIPGWHYNPKKKETQYVTEIEGFRSFTKQLLTGDRTDNIPGCAGIGPVKASKVLQDAKTKRELLQAAYEKYKELNYSNNYFREQGQLLWLRRTRGELWQPETVLNQLD